MRNVRVLLATLSIALLAGTVAVVALAAPAAVRLSAATAEYCPPAERAARQAAVNRFKRAMVNARRAYIKKLNKQRKLKVAQKRKLLAQYTQKQRAQLRAVERKLASCE